MLEKVEKVPCTSVEAGRRQQDVRSTEIDKVGDLGPEKNKGIRLSYLDLFDCHPLQSWIKQKHAYTSLRHCEVLAEI